MRSGFVGCGTNSRDRHRGLKPNLLISITERFDQRRKRWHRSRAKLSQRVSRVAASFELITCERDGEFRRSRLVGGPAIACCHHDERGDNESEAPVQSCTHVALKMRVYLVATVARRWKPASSTLWQA